MKEARALQPSLRVDCNTDCVNQNSEATSRKIKFDKAKWPPMSRMERGEANGELNRQMSAVSVSKHLFQARGQEVLGWWNIGKQDGMTPSKFGGHSSL